VAALADQNKKEILCFLKYVAHFRLQELPNRVFSSAFSSVKI
jgi:hypothetical protein